MLDTEERAEAAEAAEAVLEAPDAPRQAAGAAHRRPQERLTACFQHIKR
ncbi:hypothetical protein [Paenibacillus planticolens]|nr:hypothetical protein [Paenibacillus planticolens]